MKFILFALFVILTIQVQSQTFEEIDQGVFVGTHNPSIAIANIDAGLNETQDIIITGSGNSGWRAHLYSQDVNGSYVSVVGTFIDAITVQCKAIFGDIDGDGDEDLLITSEETKLYINDGFGDFNEITSPIANVTQGAIAFFDIDNDNDLDLLVTGFDQDEVDALATVLYTNDGNGNFVEVIGTPFEDVTNSTISYTDIDNDNDVDILITGTKWNWQRTTKLYSNDGSGVFTEVAGTSFEPVAQGSTAFADIDNDGDQDLYITGRDWQSQPVGKVYMNNGSGVFLENTNSGLTAVHESSIAFADVDGDTDLDVMITGLGTGGSGLYINDGSGSFTEVAGLPFDEFIRSAVAFKDFDNDNDLDLIIAGYSLNASDFRTKLYSNTTVLGNTEFIEVVESIIYPNPVQDSFTVQLPEEYLNNFNQIAFNLYDSIGRKVVSIPDFSSENNQINIQKLKSGLYFYEIISSEKKSSSGKLIKK